MWKSEVVVLKSCHLIQVPFDAEKPVIFLSSNPSLICLISFVFHLFLPGIARAKQCTWNIVRLVQCKDCILLFQNGHASNPYCQGIDGVLQAYKATLQNVQLYGPTNFAPCINHVARYAPSTEFNCQTSITGNDWGVEFNVGATFEFRVGATFECRHMLV